VIIIVLVKNGFYITGKHAAMGTQYSDHKRMTYHVSCIYGDTPLASWCTRQHVQYSVGYFWQRFAYAGPKPAICKYFLSVAVCLRIYPLTNFVCYITSKNCLKFINCPPKIDDWVYEHVYLMLADDHMDTLEYNLVLFILS